MITSDFSIDRDTIVSEIVSELTKQSDGHRKCFRTPRDLDYACDVINKRYQFLLQLKDKLGSTEAVIEHVEALKARDIEQAISFPTNSIHPLTLLSPLAQTQFNGLVPLPTRVDLLTGTREVHPDYTGEPVLESELMAVDDNPVIHHQKPKTQIQFNLKRMRLKQ